MEDKSSASTTLEKCPITISLINIPEKFLGLSLSNTLETAVRGRNTTFQIACPNLLYIVNSKMDRQRGLSTTTKTLQ